MSQREEALSFSDFAKSWLAAWAQVRLKPSALREYESVMRLHLVPEFGADTFAAITPERVQSWVAHMAQRGCAQSTARNRVIVLKRVLESAREYGLIDKNPVTPDAFPRLERRETAILTPPEIRRLLAATPSAWRLAIGLAALCGLRAGEIRALEWSDINSDARTISVSKSLRGGCVTSAKTSSSRSMVPLPDSLRPLVNLRRAQSSGHSLVFCRSDGRPLSDAALSRVLNRALAAAGLPQIRFHDLRHSWATAHLQAGTDLRTLAHLGRWSSPETLLDTYSHLIGIGGDAVQRFDEFISGDE